MDVRVPRREFLQGTLVTGLSAMALPRSGWTRASSAKLRHAAIGVGGMGWGDVQQIGSHPDVEVVALCDVDLARTQNAVERFPEARVYQDWRELLAREGERIDSINVTVPDHMHAPITLRALELGKHVYCQKPLTHDVVEARRVTEAAARAGVATQMGIQLSSTRGERTAVQMIRDGVIGKVESVFLWSNKDPWKYRPTGPRPTATSPLPEGLEWNGWIGTAPARPYVPEIYHPTFWRGWQDFGVGWLGDMGCHITHAAYRALGLTAPLRVRAEVERQWRDTAGRFLETWPTWQIVRYTYPGTKYTAGATIDVVWSDGDRYPPEELREHLETEDHAWPEQGALFVGEEGALLHPHGGEPSLSPGARFESYSRPQIESRNHYHHWVDTCLGRAQCEASFDYAGPLTEAVLLGTVALRVPDRELTWDAAAMKIPDLPEAERFLRRTYRDGWEVEGL